MLHIYHIHQRDPKNVQLGILLCFAYHFASFLTNLPKSLQTDKH